MKKQFVLILFFICTSGIFPEERNVIEEINIYGGRTIEQIYNVSEQAELNYSRLIQYYDSENSIVKRVFEIRKETTETTGVEIQVNYYKNNIVERYEMFLSDNFHGLYGYNRVIEEVNEEDVITRRIWFIDDLIIDVSETGENNFSLYNIDFIYEEFFRFYEPNERGDVITTSGRYFRTRSVIKFDTVLFELDNADITLMDAFSKTYGIENVGQFYSKKVRVYSENRSYWLYVQTQLEQYVLGQNATIRYYPIGLNRELYLICVGFYDIRK